MAVQVMNSKQEVEAYIAQTTPEPGGQPTETPSEPTEPTTEAPGREGEPITDPDDIEGEDGLTPRQKRDLSGKMVKAIGKKHRQLREAEEFAAAQYSERKLADERAAALARELADLKAKGQPDVSRETAADPEAGKPKREAYATDEAYWDAVIDWRADRRAAKILKEKEADAAKEREQQRLADIEAAATARITRARELVPDFVDKVGAIDAEVPPDVAAYMQESEMFAELGYYLAEHPEELTKLQKMHPRQQLVTIGKIEGTLKPFEAKGGSKATDTNGATPSETKGKDGQRSTTAASDTGTAPSRARDAAPVIRPLNGSGAAPERGDPRNMGIRETIADWSQQNHVNLHLRKRH